MRILITGGAGFIGSNLIDYWLTTYPEDNILNIDKLTYASNPDNLKSAINNSKYEFSKVDIADRTSLRSELIRFMPDGIIHLAAESHVDNSISSPEVFVNTNIVGTFNLLEECRNMWLSNADSFKQNRFHHVSTDEVYGALGYEGCFTEKSAYSPNSPYSATKASSDMLVRAYNKTYGLNTVITNCSNNFGPFQHSEKLIPTIIKTAINLKPIPIYGSGQNVRDWLYVKEHCRSIDLVFHNGKCGESYNIGNNNEWSNIDLVKKICNILNEIDGNGPNGDYKNLITFIRDRQGHDFRYAIDSNKLKQELGWESESNFDEDLMSTVMWYYRRNI